MSDLKDITDALVSFRKSRGWERYPSYKDYIFGMMVELAELADHFKWKTEEEIQQYLKTIKRILQMKYQM